MDEWIARTPPHSPAGGSHTHPPAHLPTHPPMIRSNILGLREKAESRTREEMSSFAKKKFCLSAIKVKMIKMKLFNEAPKNKNQHRQSSELFFAQINFLLVHTQNDDDGTG